MSTSDPRVSVFLPTFNQAPYIADAIDSALNQDYPNLEVVVGDDGSTDGTAEIVAGYAERLPKRVEAIVNEPHLGITGNCNRILERCSGKYIAFHAGDDLFLPGKVARQVDWLESDSARVLCGHDVDVMDERGNVLYPYSRLARLVSGTGARRLVQRTFLYSGVSLMLRASVRPRQGYDSRLPVVSDWLFFIECLASGGHYGYVDGVWARYRRHPGNITELSPDQTERRERIRTDLLLTLALIEAKYPDLVASARRGRAVILANEGLWFLWRGDPLTARYFFRGALWQSPASSRISLAGLVATYLPMPVLRRVSRRRTQF